MNDDLLRYKTLIKNLNDAILVEDENRNISLVNQAFCDLFEIPIPPETLIGTDCSQSAELSKNLFLDPDKFVESVQTTLKNRVPVLKAYFELVKGIKLERDYIPIFHESVYLGHLWVYKDLTPHYELEAKLLLAQQHLELLALTDPLTGLSNRRALFNSLQHHNALSERQNQPLSLCMIDLDDFKLVNDQYGHDKGDEVLVAFAELLTEHCRQTDILARFGGEEFIILMPNTNAQAAHALIQRILHFLNETKIINLKLTFSAGITELKRPQTIEELIRTADQAMYQVKHKGKNNVYTFGLND